MGMKPELYDTAPEFRPWGKTPRFEIQGVIITEKIDGTNALIHITDDGLLFPGSRNRWLRPGKKEDNFGFAQWCEDNHDELLKLGAGWHYGEWWGAGIGPRKYGMVSVPNDQNANRFLSLFNTRRWGAHNPTTPKCVSAVPVLYEGALHVETMDTVLETLIGNGSVVAPGFMDVEGVVAYFPKTDQRMKYLADKKHAHKWMAQASEVTSG